MSGKAQGTDVHKFGFAAGTHSCSSFPRRVRYGGTQRPLVQNVTQRRTADYYGNCPALCRGHGLMPHEATRGSTSFQLIL